MANYSKMTTDQFDEILVRLVDKAIERRGIRGLFHVDGVYEALREEYNNDVLDEWARDHPEQAYPVEDACPCCDVIFEDDTQPKDIGDGQYECPECGRTLEKLSDGWIAAEPDTDG